jgi:hypothetical protein
VGYVKRAWQRNWIGVTQSGDADPAWKPHAIRTGVKGGSVTVTSTKAPEIDPASAVSALTMLLGGLAVLRGRRARVDA